MLNPDLTNHIQLTMFRTKEFSMSIGQSVFISDGFKLPAQLPFPFRLSFTAALICIDGELKVEVNKHSITALRGDVIIIQYGSIVERIRSSMNFSTVAMAFLYTDKEWLFNRQADKLGTWLAHRSIPLLLHLDESQLQRYLAFYSQVKEFYKESAVELRDEIVKGFLSISLASLLSNPGLSITENQTLVSGLRHDEVYLRFMDDLQLYASQERSVQFYSDRLYITAKHFSKLIRQASGKLPMEHIRQHVIIEAKTLLKTTDMTIREIADAMNFPSDSFFCRYFKHDTGLSPSEYRNS